MRRLWLAVLAACALAGGAASSRGQAMNLQQDAMKKSYVVYAGEPESVVAGRPGVLLVHFRVLEGYHVNSHTPRSELLIPTTLRLTPADGVKPGQLEYPAGRQYSFSFDPKEKLDVYAGEFTVRLPVVASKGEHTLTGALHYQACDNAACYPPRSLPVEIPFTAK